MKAKTQPIQQQSGNYLEQALYKGMSKKQKLSAKAMISEFDGGTENAPVGLIRHIILTSK